MMGGSGLEARDSGAGNSFANTLQNMIGDSLNSVRQAETTTMAGLTGNVDLTDVVTAISKAELTLQAVVAVRDKVITGYQEIMRMPI
ncbi:MAG: flagellar hook-basal body complex protein FliE [Alphaproteobacteria bacterium]|nr:MAG: flagellar hook-basal body complex protein FliE [Alphaproteobacteria bacterium]